MVGSVEGGGGSLATSAASLLGFAPFRPKVGGLRVCGASQGQVMFECYHHVCGAVDWVIRCVVGHRGEWCMQGKSGEPQDSRKKNSKRVAIKYLIFRN